MLAWTWSHNPSGFCLLVITKASERDLKNWKILKIKKFGISEKSEKSELKI